MNQKISDDTRQAVTAYTGPVRQCRPGRARAPASSPPPASNKAVAWLNAHRGERPIKDAKAERSRMRRVRAQREWIDKRNAALKRRIGER